MPARSLNTFPLYWTEEENEKIDSLGELLRTALIRRSTSSHWSRKFGQLQQWSEPDRIYFASKDRKAVYYIRLFGHPEPVVDDNMRRTGWRYWDYSVYRITVKEYGTLDPEPDTREYCGGSETSTHTTAYTFKIVSYGGREWAVKTSETYEFDSGRTIKKSGFQTRYDFTRNCPNSITVRDGDWWCVAVTKDFPV